MDQHLRGFVWDHVQVSRRWLLQAAAASAVMKTWRFATAENQDSPEIERVLAELEPYFTPQAKFRDVSRGQPLPHSLPAETKQQVGMTRDSWKLEVISDPEHPARIRNPLTIADGTALDFKTLMQLAKQHAVRYSKVMTCLNIGCPLGMGIWEGVPLREILWLTKPRENLRRVFYYGYHNEKPEQMFRSSLPVSRILEDPPGLPPVILCYKLNGEWLSSERGGPVRVVVPEAYGFKSIKWLSHVVLSNLFHANDTYGEKNNDVDSPMKSFAATLSVPTEVKADSPFAVSGYAQVGLSGLRKVQVWLHPDDEDLPSGDPHFTQAPWTDASVLPPRANWPATLADKQLLHGTHGFDPETGQPQTWPMPLTKVHWVHLFAGLKPGRYILRSRTVDASGHAQPMPRPFRKSGHAAIEQVTIRVKG